MGTVPIDDSMNEQLESRMSDILPNEVLSGKSHALVATISRDSDLACVLFMDGEIYSGSALNYNLLRGFENRSGAGMDIIASLTDSLEQMLLSEDCAYVVLNEFKSHAEMAPSVRDTSGVEKKLT